MSIGQKVVGQIEIVGESNGVGHVFVDEALAQLTSYQPRRDVVDHSQTFGAVEHFNLAPGLLGQRLQAWQQLVCDGVLQTAET